jgi:hypothetical protein
MSAYSNTNHLRACICQTHLDGILDPFSVVFVQKDRIDILRTEERSKMSCRISNSNQCLDERASQKVRANRVQSTSLCGWEGKRWSKCGGIPPSAWRLRLHRFHHDAGTRLAHTIHITAICCYSLLYSYKFIALQPYTPCYNLAGPQSLRRLERKHQRLLLHLRQMRQQRQRRQRQLPTSLLCATLNTFPSL